MQALKLLRCSLWRPPPTSSAGVRCQASRELVRFGEPRRGMRSCAATFTRETGGKRLVSLHLPWHGAGMATRRVLLVVDQALPQHLAGKSFFFSSSNSLSIPLVSSSHPPSARHAALVPAGDCYLVCMHHLSPLQSFLRLRYTRPIYIAAISSAGSLT